MIRPWGRADTGALPPAVVRHWEVEFHEPEHRLQKALGSPKAQMKDRLQDQSTFYRNVGIDSRSAAPAILFRMVSGGDSGLVDPERQTASPDEGSVVLRPVADFVAKSELTFRHLRRLAETWRGICATAPRAPVDTGKWARGARHPPRFPAQRECL